MSWKPTEVLTSSAAIDYGASLIGAYRPGLRTGFAAWDAVCEETGGEGLAHWWYVVLGGASNAGKTRLLQFLLRRAVEQGRTVGMITMEVPTPALQRQWYAAITSFGYYDFLPVRWDDGFGSDKVQRLGKEVGDYAHGKGKLLIAEHDGAPNLYEIVAMLEAMRDAGCEVVALDHLQLIKAPIGEIADRATEISEELRRFAHRNQLLTIALSQLNRGAANQRERLPIMQDLWGGTSMESNCNQVMLIDHSFQERDEQHPHLMRTNLYLDKNREGTNRVLIPVEVNFKTGEWRQAEPDELHLWRAE